ncbi:MAG: PHB depolymerase family esterase [Phycisphaerales bacterium]|nr:PHB depolymerase family esterase [Phycisphaerales bacterium]MDG1978511.1 PHB depolymerase family esterase [Phycisphaerales bacterium]MDG2133494.1 PHB depolymerase family esterase [Phycisphaerales bacterium]
MKNHITLAALLVPAAVANAQSINDDCSNASTISFGMTAFSTLGASDDGPGLPADCDEGFGNGFGSDIWYTLTPDQSAGIIVSTCDAADFDTRLALYTECDGVLLACNDDGSGCSGYTSRMNFEGVEGETYLLRVGGFDEERGTGTITVEYGDGPPESPNIDFEHDGLVRQYRLYVPTDLPDSRPLVLALHGYGGGNNDMLNNYGWREMADEGGFAVAFPNGTRDQFNARFWDVDYAFHPQFDVDDNGFLSSLATHLQKTLGLDAERTFVTGFSNGAEMCFQLACQESSTFKGFAPIIGMMLDPLFLSCDPEFLRPILTMNGTSDGVTLFGGDMNNTGGWGAYRPIPEMNDFWIEELETPILDRRVLPDTAPNDGSTVRLDIYTGRDHDREFHYYQINGGGHDWPGQSGNMDIDATREVWNFFEAIGADDPANPADLNGDGQVGPADLGLVLAWWGVGSTGGDVNGDGNTDAQDIGALLAAWTG